MPAAKLARLVDLIDQSIAIRGLYVLTDDHLDLIWGPAMPERKDNPEVSQKITEFAAAHCWAVARREDGFLFLPTTGEMDFSNF